MTLRGIEHDPHRDALRVRAADRRLRGGRPARHRLHLHRRADLASGRSLSPVLRHAGGRAAALGCARRRARGAAAVEQAQRHDLRRGPEPDRLRARDIEPGARTAGRAARSARDALRRAGAQFAERRLRALQRRDLFLRPLVRPHAGLRRRAAAPARLPGRLSHSAGRRRAAASRRPQPVRAAERPLLLAGREAALRQRYRHLHDLGVRGERRRIACRTAASSRAGCAPSSSPVCRTA